MSTKLDTRKSVIAHRFNGNIEGDEKFVEVDGQKFVDDGTGKPKVGEDQKPIPFVEKKADDGADEKSLEELAKTNPAIAKLLEDKKKAEKDLSDKLAKESEERQAQLAKNGEWEKLAKEQEAEIARLKEEDGKKFEIIGKYKGSIKSILDATLATIPKDKIGLIPDSFSEREKLEYITKNAKLLGATIIAVKGDKVEKNEDEPNLGEEDTLRKELGELIKKGSTRTATEDNLMTEKSRKLKELQTKRLQGDKK
jgi:hypothetical protein